MDFLLVILFLILYYVRPHEWMEVMVAVQPITKVMAMSLVAVVVYTGRRTRWQPLRFVGEFLRSPVDWMMLLFILYILHISEDRGTVWAALYALVAYYVVVEHALSSLRRLEIFMWVWLALILFISIMAVLSEFEIDPFGSYGWTHGMYKGRLVLNLSIFRNPNALGHSIVLILPMIYFLGIWHRFLLLQELSLPLYIMPFWCLYWTASKGAFLSGGAGMLATLTVGRPKWLQASVLTLAYVLGMSALMLLPRMHELESIRADAGVRGRLLAWEFAWSSFENLPNGLGYQQFTKHVPVYTEGDISVRKPTHSSYVEVGAELGKRGLFIWLGLLYYCIKCLAFTRTGSDQEERLRRLLLTLMVIYMASSWMTNISYRGTFFIQVGAVAALLRLVRQRTREEHADATAEELALAAVPEAPGDTAESNAMPPMTVITAVPAPDDDTAEARKTGGEEDTTAEGDEAARNPLLATLWQTIKQRFSWWKLGLFLLDLGLIYLLYRAVIWAWLYFMLDWTGF